MYGIYHDHPVELRDPRGRRVKERKRRHHCKREEADSDDSMYNRVFTDSLVLDGVLGQQMVMWTFREPDTLNLYTPVIGDNLATVVTRSKEALQYDPKRHKLMMMTPGAFHPMDISQFYKVEPGAVVMIMPKNPVIINIEVKQLNLNFQIEVDLSMTVLQLKFRLQEEKGLSVERLDLLFKDQQLVNRDYLFNYRIGKQSTIFVMIHILYDMLVHVETFWGCTYHLYLDPCMTGMNVIWTVLRRTVTKNTPDIMALFDLYLPKHTLVLYHKKKVVNWSTCLGYYKIDDNDVLKLSTVGIYHKLGLQKIPICDDVGKMHTVKVSKFDRWAAVALKMHGVVGVSVNLIQLFKGQSVVDFSETIGKYNFSSPPVNMDISLSKADPDVLYGISLNFRLGNDVTEILKVSSKRNVRTVKAILEQLGVPNASVYDMYLGEYKMTNNEKLVASIEDLTCPIDLKLTQYPVFVHTNQKVIYKMMVYAQESVAAFKKRIEMKTGLSFSNFRLFLAGQDFDHGDELTVFETPIAIRSSLFMRPKVRNETFFILYDDYMLKFKIPQKPKSFDLKQFLLKDMTLPAGALASIGTFLQWYYTGRDNPLLPRGKLPKKVGRYHFSDPTEVLHPHQRADYRELQDDLRGPLHADKSQNYPYKPVQKQSNPLIKAYEEQVRKHDRYKSRSFSYPAHIFPSYENVKEKNKEGRRLKGYRSAEEYEKAHGRNRTHQPRWYHTLERQRDKRLASPRLQEDTYFLKKSKR